MMMLMWMMGIVYVAPDDYADVVLCVVVTIMMMMMMLRVMFAYVDDADYGDGHAIMMVR